MRRRVVRAVKRRGWGKTLPGAPACGPRRETTRLGENVAVCARACRETKQGKGMQADAFLKPIELLVHEITTSADGDADPRMPQ